MENDNAANVDIASAGSIQPSSEIVPSVIPKKGSVHAPLLQQRPFLLTQKNIGRSRSESRERKKRKDSDILHPQCHGSALPVTVRNLIRSNVFGTRSTAGVAEGYKQASIVILHQSLADDFEKFCHGNSGPLPLLYKSKIGEWDCPPLATDADIRTDCPLYNKYEFGEVTATLTNLMDYAEQLREMVTFYLGCSFSLEPLVLRAGVPIRNVEQGCNVSMFKTKVSCFTVGSFHCNLVVCMRPIPEDKLNAVTQITHPLHDLHGAPLHIGDPGLLGIENLSRPDYGDPVQPQPGDVPVFWACGVSGVEAVRSTKTAALAFTHSPGCMFITDLKSEKNDISPAIHLSETPCVFSVSKNPLHYSITSAESVQRIRRLERLITADSDERGNKNLLLQDELLKAALSLSHAKSVLIMTGFSTYYDHNLPKETDGLPGAIAMTAMLHALNKEVSIVTDQKAIHMHENIIKDAILEGILKTPAQHMFYQHKDTDSALMFLCYEGNLHKPRFDCLIARGHFGMAADRNYYHKKKENIKHHVDPTDELFVAAQTIPGMTTTGKMQLHHHVDHTDELLIAAQTILGMTTTGKMQLPHHVDPTDELFVAAQTIPGMTTTGKMQLHHHVDPTDELFVAAQTIPGMTTTERVQLHHHVDPTDGLFVAAQTIPGMTTTGKMQLHHHVDPTDELFVAVQTIPGMTTTGKMQLHHHVDPTDELFIAAQTIPGMTTTGKMQLHHHVDPTDELFVAAQTIPGMTTTGKMQLHHHVDPTDELFVAAKTIPGMTTTGKMRLHHHVDPTDELFLRRPFQG
ncbi:D-glutamate cyclase, mitochondrial-like [Protopterus annectens]|uniref:D-glutamate cyclase, mitochondrial-like n=1 Tax=Protopterus annectens TaxID=7888 RepID=UPI001CFB8024|nr:D-glutamate cyclase, mitochondrial-like [Protopterus annectens]